VKIGYRYRFYPNAQQQLALAQLFGCVRVAWNDALASCKNQKYPGFAQLDKDLTQSKKKEERLWMRDVSSVPLTQAIRQLDAAYQRFFHKRAKRPRFKKKVNQQSATFRLRGFSLKEDGSFVVEVDPEQVLAREPSVGVHLGINTFAMLSNGEAIKSPDYSRLYQRIARLQKGLARRQKGSRRWHKRRLAIARTHNFEP